MKKRIISIRKILGITLAAVLISGISIPGRVSAQETEQAAPENPDVPAAEALNDSVTEKTEETGINGTEGNAVLSDGQDEGGDTGSIDTGSSENEDTDSLSENRDTSEPGGAQETPVPPAGIFPVMAVAVPMDESDSMYAQLEQFLTLIADRFEVYTVAVVTMTDPTDPSSWQPADPEDPVEVSLEIPGDFDTSRTVVAELGQDPDGQTPTWAEISYERVNGNAVFNTDHSGLFVVAEEKQWTELPGSFEMTSKVDKLELTGTHPSGSPVSGTASAAGYSSSIPATGDDGSVYIWIGITVLAAAAVIAGIIVMIRRRK